MKQSLGEMKMENEQLVRDFVLAAFEKKHLAEQIDSFCDSIDDLGADLEIEGRQQLFQNASDHLKKLAAKLEALENRLQGMLPTLIAVRESISSMTSPMAAAGAVQQIQAIADAASQRGTPIRPADVKPETPTLMAMEPAPLLSEDDDGEQYRDALLQSEDVEEPSFDHPAPLIESTSMAEDDTEAISVHKLVNADITPPVLFESSSNESLDEPLALDIPYPSALDARVQDEQPIALTAPVSRVDSALESWAGPPAPASVPEIHAASTDVEALDVQTDDSDAEVGDSDEVEVGHSDETVVRAAPLPDERSSAGDSVVPLSREETEAIEALELAHVPPEPENTAGTEYATGEFPEPGELGNLASVLEPDIEDGPTSAMPSDAVSPAQWDEEEPPTANLGNSLEGTTEEAHILFWKQKATQRQSSQTSVDTSSDDEEYTARPDVRHSTVSSAVTAVTAEVATELWAVEQDSTSTAKQENLDDENLDRENLDHENLDHIEDYDDSDDVSSEGVDAVDIDTAENALEESFDDTLEQELYQLIDAAPAGVPETPTGVKETLMGMGHPTSEKGKAIAVDHTVEDTQPFSHMDSE